MKLPWLLRDPTWRTFHLHRCLDCKRKFCDEEPGSWADHRYHEFPELCSPYSCQNLRHGGPQPRGQLPVTGAVLPSLRGQGRS